MSNTAKKVLWVVACVAAFIITFGVCFKIGVSIPTNKYYKPLEVDWNDKSGEVVKDFQFGDWEGTGYDLYIPAELNKEKQTSLILFIHGGGFTAGDKSEEDKWCKFYATKGYIVATVNYTLQTDKTKSNLNLMDEQILACVTAVKSECAKRNMDIKQMALSGQSAGGCLAMLYAYKNADISPIPVKFVFQQSGPTTFEPTEWGAANDDYKTHAEFATNMTGKTVTVDMAKDGSYKAIIDEISPSAYVNATTVPTICGYGPKDKIVPVGQKTVLFEQFDKFGVTYKYLNFANSGHGLLSDPDMQEEFVKLSLEYCAQYFN